MCAVYLILAAPCGRNNVIINLRLNPICPVSCHEDSRAQAAPPDTIFIHTSNHGSSYHRKTVPAFPHALTMLLVALDTSDQPTQHFVVSNCYPGDRLVCDCDQVPSLVTIVTGITGSGRQLTQSREMSNMTQISNTLHWRYCPGSKL